MIPASRMQGTGQLALQSRIPLPLHKGCPMQYSDLLIEIHDKVAVIRLNRPKALNALNDNMMNELGDALYKFDADSSIGCIILTGSEKAFAAGADIAAMAEYDYGVTYS